LYSLACLVIEGEGRGAGCPVLLAQEAATAVPAPSMAENAFSKTNKGLYMSQETVYFGTEPL
jgi:hypothetical protein